MRVSATLIVKNEAPRLAECLGSIAGVVDEIVVVDTGSTDGSREIAAAGGARVHEYAWHDDFAAARNHALGLARGEWILYVDADERLRPCSRSALHEQLADPGHVAHYVLLHPRVGFTPYWELRLFRNDPLIRFRGVVHENIWPGINALRAARGGRIGRTELVLDHVGYEGDQVAKHRRNRPLLEKALAEDPERIYCWCHLAIVHLGLGDEAAAEAAWTRALELTRRKTGQLLAEDSLPYLGLIEFGDARGRDVEPLLSEGLRRFPLNLQLVWLHGRFLMKAGRFEDAIACFEQLLAAGERGDFDRSMAYDARLFDLFAWEALATCHFQRGRFAEAARYFGLAADRDPDRLEYRVKRQLCTSLLAGAAGASHDGG